LVDWLMASPRRRFRDRPGPSAGEKLPAGRVVGSTAIRPTVSRKTV
jgi:hypothetical protein